MDNLISRSREYLYAESFEEWLMKKYEISEEEFKSFPYDRRDMLKDEYMDDKDFAAFTSGDRVMEPDDAPAREMDLPEPGGSEKGGIIAAVSVALAVITLLIWFRPFANLFGTDSTTREKESAYETEQYAKNMEKGKEDKTGEAKDGYVTVTDVIVYRGLTPGKEYTLTATPMNRETGKPYTDENGNAIEITKTFTPKTSDGSEEIVVELPLPKKGSEIIVQEEVSQRDKNGVEQTVFGRRENTWETAAESHKEKYVAPAGIPKVFIFIAGGIVMLTAWSVLSSGRHNDIS